MRVLVLGSKGSMGRRYCAILKYLQVDYVGIDKEDGDFEYNQLYDVHPECTHTIIATPTATHYGVLRDVVAWGARHVLCEKPLTKDKGSIENIIKFFGPHSDIRMVCNYKYAFRKDVKGWDIEYSNYNTGKDGLGWDCIQLIYLAENIKLSTETPFFQCMAFDPVSHIGTGISLTEVEQSYITMIKHWLELGGNKNDLWNLQDAKEATEKTIEWMKN